MCSVPPGPFLSLAVGNVALMHFTVQNFMEVCTAHCSSNSWAAAQERSSQSTVLGCSLFCRTLCKLTSHLGCGFVPWIKVFLQALLQYKARKHKTTNIWWNPNTICSMLCYKNEWTLPPTLSHCDLLWISAAQRKPWWGFCLLPAETAERSPAMLLQVGLRVTGSTGSTELSPGTQL